MLEVQHAKVGLEDQAQERKMLLIGIPSHFVDGSLAFHLILLMWLIGIPSHFVACPSPGRLRSRRKETRTLFAMPLTLCSNRFRVTGTGSVAIEVIFTNTVADSVMSGVGVQRGKIRI